ncbi:MAG: hypothetical protein K8L91_19970 [Anaerolineae bacterium]|nr:hypothetical protein [Anaerolineae bacterium]
MSERILTQKLGIKAGHKCLILNAPEGYLKQLGELPPNTALATEPDGNRFDVVQVFVHNKTDVDTLAPIAIDALKHDGLLWMTYPKKSSKIKTDITRDIGWETVNAKGLETVAAISINDTWSGLRFRPSEKVKRRKNE